jgi:membrane protease YdiL (CAAX protease family)
MTRRSLSADPNVQFAGMLLIAAAGTAAFWVGSGLGEALQAGAVLFGFALLVHLGRGRSQALMTMSGTGDEREADLGRGAMLFAGSVMALVIPSWWLVTVAQGTPNETLGILGAVYGVAFVGASIVLPRLR